MDYGISVGNVPNARNTLNKCPIGESSGYLPNANIPGEAVKRPTVSDGDAREPFVDILIANMVINGINTRETTHSSDVTVFDCCPLIDDGLFQIRR